MTRRVVLPCGTAKIGGGAPVAQGIEHRFPKPVVAGSNPAGGIFMLWDAAPFMANRSGAGLIQFDEISQDRKSYALAFLRVELGGDQVID